jgi:hypothetical protein
LVLSRKSSSLISIWCPEGRSRTTSRVKEIVSNNY